ncbi:endopeptidase La [Gammaproteobacteria bacterium]|nr:endopeptidase La [Gammaproteobacteria bacterium]
MASDSASLDQIPTVPLRDMVVFPQAVQPLFVGTETSINALDSAMSADKKVLLVAKKEADKADPRKKDLFQIGTVATILQLLKLPDGTVKVLVEGEARASVRKFDFGEKHISANIEFLSDKGEIQVDSGDSLFSVFEDYVGRSKKIPQEVLASLSGIESLSRLVDSMAAQMPLEVLVKQRLLETTDLTERKNLLLGLIDAELEILETEKKIRGRVKKQMEKSQRDYYLNEQIKAIQKEMGEGEQAETDELQQQVDRLGLPKEAKDKAQSELNKLKNMSPMSAEASVVRSFLDWIIAIPWSRKTRLRKDLKAAQKILDEDHYGLDEVKERIIEFLAVQNRVKQVKGPVLCLVGPPGVGKTSLGESVARATNRKFVRMSLGGVRDEAEIRGHRRTYIGSMPGKILQKMSKSAVVNPLFLLDEIDKMGMDVRGDPASALLEVLDPEQNDTFNDHYLEVDYDLSNVFFVCTSNSMNIPAPLLDRMEVIRLPGYTEDEKLNIAKKYLVPKQLKLSGLKQNEMSISDTALVDIIRFYTKEAGVRGLEREIAKLARKVVTEKELGRKDKKTAITEKLLEKYNGVRKFSYGLAEEENQIGIVTGLAWTQVGGELLNIEAVVVPGKGQHTKTGSLGDVMQESIQAALTFVRSRAASLGLASNFLEKKDIHIHVPEGATPKDGPSAGVGMCTALVSVLTGIPVKADVAMTGEITLRGQVLPIGGLKEKLLAAHRGGIKSVIIPADNEKDLKEIPENVKNNLQIIPVKWVDEVLTYSLESQPIPKRASSRLGRGVTGSSKRVPSGRKKREDRSSSIKTH